MLEMRVSLANVFGTVILSGIWVLSLRARSLYKPVPSRGPVEELKQIALAAVMSTVIFAALGVFFKIRLFTPVFLATFLAWLIISCGLLRQLLVSFLQSFHLGDKNLRNVVIVGTNQTAWDYAKQIKENQVSGYKLLGFVDDLVVIAESGSQHLGVLSDFNQVLETYVIDELVIAMPIRSCSDSIRNLIDQAHERGIAVRFPMAQIFSGLTSNEVWRTRQEATLGANGCFLNDLVVYSGHQLGGRYLLKRIMDICASLILLVLSSPLLIFAALGIWITDGRPVLFIQHRYGYNGRVFNLYKFRTMVKNADAMQEQLRALNERDGAAFKLKNDPRVTWLGRFLRKTSIDELPQLFNVLKGEMSLVGPRPLPLADYKRMNKTSHRRRLSVLPGITGPWQISGRDQISFEEWMQMDLDYIDNWRLMTDLKIILLTVPTVLLARGSK